MRNLGLSIYPSLSGEEQIREYLQTGKRWGFQHLFTCLRASGIQQPGGKEKFARLLAYAHSLGYTVSCDVNHFLMEEAFGHAMELREIRELGIDRIRFDYGYSAEQIAEWSNHREGLLFELNMSGSKFALPHLWELGGNLHAFVGCHNFYPLRNTGLSYEQFKERNRLYKSYGIATAAFLGPADSHLFCVWPEAEGVVTLEESRDWSLSGQLAALFSDPFLDQAIVGNCFINEEECRVLSLLLDDFPHLPWIPSPGLPSSWLSFLNEESFQRRLDGAEDWIRCSQSRGRLDVGTDQEFLPTKIEVGDVLLAGPRSGHYSGELFIAGKHQENPGFYYKIGTLEYSSMVNWIQPGQSFRLYREK